MPPRQDMSTQAGIFEPMANHCDNRVVISGDAKALAVVRDELASPGDYGGILDLDFMKIARPPDDLDGEELRSWKQANWGCESQPGEYDVILRDEGPGKLVYVFVTHWTQPRALIRTLAESHPEVIVEFTYTELDSRLAGTRRWEDGWLVEAIAAEPESEAVVELLEGKWPTMAEVAREYYFGMDDD